MPRTTLAKPVLALFSALLIAAPAAIAQPATDPGKAPAPSQPKKEEPKKDEPKPAPAQPAPAKPAEPAPAKPAEPEKQPLVYVTMKTSKGEIFLELNQEKAPISVANFLAYVDKGHYEGTVFHRVMDGFMIQGGGFDKDLKQKPTDKPIKNEWKNGLKNVRGSIAMARTPVADSATSQFFINVVDNPNLDRPNDGAAYAVFGRVVKGMDVVDAIRVVKTGQKNGMANVPMETVTIEKVTRTPSEQVEELKKAEKK